MSKTKILITVAVMSVYIFVPAYRYYAFGTWMGYKLINAIKESKIQRIN